MRSAEVREWVELLLPVVIGLAIAGSGGWTEQRWLAALPVMGLGGARQLGFEKGFATYNPALRKPPGSQPKP